MGGFTKIGSSDLTNTVALALPSAERNFRLSNANTGFMNTYSSTAATYSGTLTNYTTGYGYIARTAAREAHYKGDGVNGYVNYGDVTELNLTSEFTLKFNVKFSSTASVYLLDKQVGSTLRMYFAILSGIAYFRLINGAGAGFNLTGFFSLCPVGTNNDIVIKYNGSESVASDRLKLYINGNLITSGYSTIGTIPTTTGDYSGQNLLVGGNLTSSLNGEINLFYLSNKAKSSTWILQTCELGSALGGLIGSDLGSGLMSLSDNRIGLFNPYNNIMSALLSTDPATVDRNTGYINCFNGESATGTITLTMVNCPTGYGFIAKSGATPAHLLGDGVGAEVSTANTSWTLSDVMEKSFIVKFRLNSLGAIQMFSGSLTGAYNYWIGLWTNNKLAISINDGLNSTQRWEGTATLTTGVDYTACFVIKNGVVSIYLNGELEVLTLTGTIYPVVVTFADYVLLDRSIGGGFYFSGRIYDFQDYSTALNQYFIQDQYYSSKNEWQGDLTGTLQAVPDGTLDLSAEYTYLDAQHVWLENHNFSAIPHDWGCGQVGEYSRSAGVGYTDESLARFDISQFSGETVNSVRLITYDAVQGTQVSSTTSKVYEQNKTSLVGVTDAPVFDDFAQTAWDTVLSSLAVQNIGSYEYLDGSNLIKGLVQNWINGTKDSEDGIIIDANFQAVGYYLYVCSVKLGVKISTGGTVIVPFHILNYLNQSF